MQTGSPAFTDLPADNSLYPDVRYLAGKNIISGFPDGSFRPADSITRAEAAKIMVLAKGLTPANGGATTFSDVPAWHWAVGVIEAAVQDGLFEGYPDGTFNPEGGITRAEAITLLMRLSGGPLTDETVEIADVPAGHWAYRQVATAIRAGLAELSADQSFKPDVNFQRGEMAKSLSALFTLSPVLRPNVLTGTLTAKSGTVTVNGVRVANSVKVSAGDTIATRAGSQAEIAFDDGSGFLIEPGTELTITVAQGFNYMKQDGTAGVAVDKLTVSLKIGSIFGALSSRHDDNQTAYIEKSDNVLLASLDLSPGILLAEGESADSEAAWWNEPYAQRTRVEVDMPWGVAAIRGTFWGNLVTASGEGSTSVLTGSATVTSSGGQTVPLTGGQASTVAPGGAPPTPPAPMSPAQSQAFAGAQDWVNQRAQEIQNNLPPAPAVPGAPGAPQSPPNVVGAVTGALNQVTSGLPPANQTTGNSGGGIGIPVGSSTPTAAPVAADPVTGTEMAIGDCVTLTTLTSGAAIYYTTDESVPDAVYGIPYYEPIEVISPVTIKAIAVKAGYHNSPISTFSYTVAQVATPYVVDYDTNTIVPPGYVNKGTLLNLRCDTVGASVYYTTDGSKPTASSSLYLGGSIPVTEPLTIRAIAVKSGWANSEEMNCEYDVPGTAVLTGPETEIDNAFYSPIEAKLFAFKLILDGEDVTAGGVVIDVIYAEGVNASDLDDLKLYIDNDGTLALLTDDVTAQADGDVLTGIQISGFQLTTAQSECDIVLVGDVDNIEPGDRVIFEITTEGFTGLTGVTSGLAITPTGESVEFMHGDAA